MDYIEKNMDIRNLFLNHFTTDFFVSFGSNKTNR